jgi:hypothetical protein
MLELTSRERAINQAVSELITVLARRDIKYRLSVMDGAWWLWSGNGDKAWCLRKLRRVLSTKELVILLFSDGGELIITSHGNWIDRT